MPCMHPRRNLPESFASFSDCDLRSCSRAILHVGKKQNVGQLVRSCDRTPPAPRYQAANGAHSPAVLHAGQQCVCPRGSALRLLQP